VAYYRDNYATLHDYIAVSYNFNAFNNKAEGKGQYQLIKLPTMHLAVVAAKVTFITIMLYTLLLPGWFEQDTWEWFNFNFRFQSHLR
jgi:hypothetical protein